ncbi:hypothetical protein [Planococcus shixiaomingii]|uniref:hypothetical protein n=1 Tax=Planococcus shixiaomingii TaxID=3058393 RepID=UPI0026164B41|nr:hypothetical protein [Planococcus sp. N022]WKA55462.1 hypothetical protein QWY21_03515 [Planococcus sp. N022]
MAGKIFFIKFTGSYMKFAGFYMNFCGSYMANHVFNMKCSHFYMTFSKCLSPKVKIKSKMEAARYGGQPFTLNWCRFVSGRGVNRISTATFFFLLALFKFLPTFLQFLHALFNFLPPLFVVQHALLSKRLSKNKGQNYIMGAFRLGEKPKGSVSLGFLSTLFLFLAALFLFLPALFVFLPTFLQFIHAISSFLPTLIKVLPTVLSKERKRKAVRSGGQLFQ